MALQTLRIRDYMSRRLVVLSPETEILQALNTLLEHGISGAPVLDKSGALLGILTEKDCMEVMLNAAYYSEYAAIVADFMTPEVVSVGPDEGIVSLAKRFLNDPYHRYPVTENGRLVGVISRGDVVRALQESWQWAK